MNQNIEKDDQHQLINQLVLESVQDIIANPQSASATTSGSATSPAPKRVLDVADRLINKAQSQIDAIVSPETHNNNTDSSSPKELSRTDQLKKDIRILERKLVAFRPKSSYKQASKASNDRDRQLQIKLWKAKLGDLKDSLSEELAKERDKNNVA